MFKPKKVLATCLLTGPVFAVIMLLASLNSCTNPWIYLYYS